ncbi:hypothetical protein [Streptomyces sp. WZ.A104]|nr:hypothetical protein [Streptomyces sp. WZ.A104]
MSTSPKLPDLVARWGFLAGAGAGVAGAAAALCVGLADGAGRSPLSLP